MSDLMDNEFVAVIVALFIGLYAMNLGKMKLPSYIKNLFDNNIFKIVFLSLLLVYRFEKSPHVALAVALVFVLTIDYLYNQQVKENFLHIESFREHLNNKDIDSD